MKMMSTATASLKSSKVDGFATLWAWGLAQRAQVLHFKFCAAAIISLLAPPRMRCLTIFRLDGCPKFWCNRLRAPATLPETLPLNEISDAPLPGSVSTLTSSPSSGGPPPLELTQADWWGKVSITLTTFSVNSSGYTPERWVSRPCTLAWSCRPHNAHPALLWTCSACSGASWICEETSPAQQLNFSP